MSRIQNLWFVHMMWILIVNIRKLPSHHAMPHSALWNFTLSQYRLSNDFHPFFNGLKTDLKCPNWVYYVSAHEGLTDLKCPNWVYYVSAHGGLTVVKWAVSPALGHEQHSEEKSLWHLNFPHKHIATKTQQQSKYKPTRKQHKQYIQQAKVIWLHQSLVMVRT